MMRQSAFRHSCGAAPIWQPRGTPARPDPGRESWADARGGEIRAASRAQIDHLCRWWIRQAISRAQRAVPHDPATSHVIERQNKLYAATSRLWTSHGRAPSARELSAALGWTPQEVEALLIAVQPIAQLQQAVTDGGDALQDFVEDTQAPQPDELVAEEQVRRGVRECLGHLTEREAMIMQLRYGLDAHEPHSSGDIGVIYGISRERVRQLEKGALAKLRRLQQSAVLAELVQ